MSWIKFSATAELRYSKAKTYYYALHQDAVKGIVVNPDNQIVFELGLEDTSYATEPYASQNQALMIMNDILNKWGKNIEVPNPKDVTKYLEGIKDGENKERDSK